MAGDSCDFTEWVKRGDLESLGMEAQVISRSETEDEQYVWEIGLLNLTLLDTDEGVLVFYDVNTNMIFSCESYGQSELNSDEVYAYYKEAGVNEPSVIFDKEYWMIAAISEAEIYGNMLVTELNELLWYHWNSYYEYPEKIVGEETEKEIDSMP